MRLKAFGMAAVLALALAAPGAKAETVTITSQTPGNVFGDTGFQTVSVTVPGTGTVGARAGAFQVREGVRDFLAWCVDAAVNLSLPAEGRQYTSTDTPFGNGQTLAATVVSNIQRLFDTAYANLDLTNSVQTAGFQLALWEIIYEKPTNTFNVTSGDFRETSGNAAVLTAASGFLSGLDGPATSRFELTFWEAETGADGKRLSQNLLEATVIPLPAGVWMLLAALGALVAAGRARRTA